MAKIINLHCELVKLCYIDRSGLVSLRHINFITPETQTVA